MLLRRGENPDEVLERLLGEKDTRLAERDERPGVLDRVDEGGRGVHVRARTDDHPGGAKILKRMAGKDSTKQFWKYHGKSVLEKYGPKLKVGTLKEEAKL